MTVDTRRNRYCGPFAVAYVLGLESSADGAAAIRDVTGERAVTTAYNGDLLRAIRRAGGPKIVDEGWFRKGKRPTLAAFLRGRRGGFYLVNVTRHYIVVDGWHIYDNVYPDGRKRRDWPHRRKRVKAWWRFR